MLASAGLALWLKGQGGGIHGWLAALVIVIVPVCLGARWTIDGVPRSLLVGALWPAVLSALVLLRPAPPSRPSAAVVEAAPGLPSASQHPTPPEAPPGDPKEISFEGNGHNIVMLVRFYGANGEPRDLPMLFDTGASTVTLDKATLTELGYPIPSNAPVIESRTANGPTREPAVLIDRLEVAGTSMGPVTVSRCDVCRDGDTRGLLGLNVTGRFLITLDLEGRRISLTPRASQPELTRDLTHWAKVQVSGTVEGGVLLIEGTLENIAGVAMTEVDVDITCGNEAGSLHFKDVAPGGTASADLRQLSPECGEIRYTVGQGIWATP